MKYHSNKTTDSTKQTEGSKRKPNAKSHTLKAKKAFSLIEALSAVIILAIISSSVLVVINRCMVSAIDSTLRMQAFEVARENMEKLLASDSVKEMVEFGSSEKHPEIQWQTTVEAFYEPITNRMWIRGTCSAEYTDTEGQLRTVELTHWLTDVTKEQLRQILDQQQREKKWLAEQIVETVEEAAEYAGVNEGTIEQWVENGMPRTNEGYYIKDWLDLYEGNNGTPSPEAQKELALTLMDITGPAEQQGDQAQSRAGEGPTGPTDPTEYEQTGTSGKTYIFDGRTYTEAELNQMSFPELWELIMSSEVLERR